MYIPTKEELNEAIHLALEDKTAPKDVYHAVQKENPNWKVSQRKVAKYVKRQIKAKHPGLSPEHEYDDDMSVSTIGSMASRARSLVKRTVGKGKDKHDDSSTLASASVTGKIKSKLKFFHLSYHRKRGGGNGIPAAVPESIDGITAPPASPTKGKVEYSAVDMSPLPVAPSPDAPSTADTSAADSEGHLLEREGVAAGGTTAVKNLEESLSTVEEKPVEKGTDGAYTDDNDGKKDDCCAQGGCIIL